MAGKIGAGYRKLSRQAAMIAALATFAWCSFAGVALLDALFRAAVVYLLMILLFLTLRGVLARMIDWVIAEARRRRAERSRSKTGVPKIDSRTGGTPSTGDEN